MKREWIHIMIKIIKGNKVKKTALSLAICVAMALPTVSNALSLGEIQSNSSLNQPFKGKIHLLSANGADARNLRVRVASPDVFNRVGIDRPAFLNSIRFQPTVENGKPVILISSDQAIHEPFLNFLLEVSWPNGQLLKEYTVLLDPPVLSRPNTAIASNTAGIRPEPRAQGRISRPAIQPARRVQQPRRVVRAAAPQRAPARRAPVRRAAPVARRVASANRVTSYKVRSGDTLSKVAAKLGYNGIRSEQMMVALYEKNRRAFFKNNMNNLKAGVRLTRPSAQEARALSSRSAKSQIIAQARDWKKARATTVAKVDNKTAQGSKVASNQQARLEVSGNNNSQASFANAAGSKTVRELNKQLTMLTESLTTKKNENEELKSRVSELESLLRKKNRLITLKSEQLANLQELVGSPSDQTAAENGQATISESIIDEGTGIQAQTQLENNLAGDTGQIIRVENDPSNAVLSQNQQFEPAEDPKLITQNFQEEVVEEVVEADVTEGSTDIMGLLSSPAAMGVGGGSLLALLGGLWFMRRRKNNEYEEFDYDEQDEINIDDAEPVSQFEEQPFENIEEEVEEIGTHEIDESEFVEHDGLRQEHMKNSGLLDDDQEDLLQEADVYIVYGLHDQAESELKQAIQKDPENLAYRAKLLENYKAAGNKEAFTEETKAFMSLDVSGKEKYLDDISEWGSALVPDSNLFSGEGLKSGFVAAAGAGVAMVAGTAIAKDDNALEESVSDSLSDNTNDNLDDFTSFDSFESTDDQALDVNHVEIDDDGLESFDLDDVLAEDSDDEFTGDFNFDLDDNEFNIETETDAEDSGLIDDIEVEPVSLDMGNETLEIGGSNIALGDVSSDLSNNLLDDDLPDELGANIDLSDTNFDFEEMDLESELDEEIDIDLSSLNTSFEDVSAEGEDEIFGLSSLGDDEQDEDNTLGITSLNLDLDANDFNKIMPEDHHYKNTVNEPEETSVDGKIDDNEEQNLLAEFDDNLSFLDLDNNDSDSIEETQIDTKLDLAKAYIDMGDIDGARSTLEEVLQEGSDEQKRVAEELLHQTG